MCDCRIEVQCNVKKGRAFFQARSPADADLVRKAQTDGIRLPQRADRDAACEAGGEGVLQRLPAQGLRPPIWKWFLKF